MTMRPRDHKRARALQEALERYERLLAAGSSPEQARREASGALGEDARLLALATRATRLRSRAYEEGPDRAAVVRGLSRIRSTPFRPATRSRWSALRSAFPQPALVPAAVAASVIAAALVLLPALNSLPGDRMYVVKEAAESTRLVMATGSGEARLNIKLAQVRLDEVEGLLQRAGGTSMGFLVPGLNAAGASPELDPELAELVWQTFVRAGGHLKSAVDYYATSPGPAPDDLDEVVEVSRRGQKLVSDVVDELPPPDKPRVLVTATELAKIEADATAARERTEPEPTIPPCDTPTPEPSPTPEPEATPTPEPDETAGPRPSPATPAPAEHPEAGEDSGAAEATATPEPSPVTPTPEPTPCYTPTPAPTPTPTPSPEPTPEPSPDTVEPAAEEDDEAVAA